MVEWEKLPENRPRLELIGLHVQQQTCDVCIFGSRVGSTTSQTIVFLSAERLCLLAGISIISQTPCSRVIPSVPSLLLTGAR